MTPNRTPRVAALSALMAGSLWLAGAIIPAAAQDRDHDRGERDSPRAQPVPPPQGPPQAQSPAQGPRAVQPGVHAPSAQTAPMPVQGQARVPYSAPYQGPASGQARFQGYTAGQAGTAGQTPPAGRPGPPAYSVPSGTPSDYRRSGSDARGPDRDGGRWPGGDGRDSRREAGRDAWRDGARDGYREWGRDPHGDRGGGDRHEWRYRGEVHPGYRVAPYRYPGGWGYRSWRVGERLPFQFLTSYYFLDAYAYDLPPAPYGYRWVRYGSDALLVNVYTGEVEDVVYGIFYW